MGSPQLPGYTREYDYETNDEEKSPNKKPVPVGAFSYENQSSPKSEPMESQSPTTRRATGLAFNYAPGEEDVVARNAEKLREKSPKSEQSPTSKRAIDKNKSSFGAPASFNEPVHAKDPKADTAAFLAGEQYGVETPEEKTIPAAKIAAVGKGKTRVVKLFVVTGKKDPKTGNIDAENGEVDISTATQNLETGLIDSKHGLIDPEDGRIIITDPASGKKEVVQGVYKPATGQIYVTNGAVLNPATGKRDASLGQIITVIRDDSNSTGPLKLVPKKQLCKIMVTLLRRDPKNNAYSYDKFIYTIDGIVDPQNDTVETKLGLIDLKNKTITTKNAKGEAETKPFANIEFASSELKDDDKIVVTDIVDPRTGKHDSNLAAQISTPHARQTVVEITSIIAERGQMDINKVHKETTNGRVDPRTGEIATKYGTISIEKMKIASRDPESKKMEYRSIQLDKQNNIIIPSGVVDPKTGKKDPSLSQIVQVKPEVDPEYKVQSVVGKVDKKNAFETRTFHEQNSVGLFDPEKQKIYTKYGVMDPISETLTYIDPKTGKGETKQAYRETGEFRTPRVLYKGGFTNPKTGKPDSHYGRTLHVETDVPAVHPDADNQPTFESKSPVGTPVKAPIAPMLPAEKNKIVKIMIITAKRDPKTGHLDVENGTVDNSAAVLHPDGKIETKYGLIDAKNATMVITDPATGQKETVSGHVDSHSGQIVIPGPAIDPKTGKKDPNLGQVISVVTPEEKPKQTIPFALTSHPVPKKRIVKIMVITSKIDPKTGRSDPDKGTVEKLTAIVDPVTGHIDTKYGLVDPDNLKIIHKDPKTGKWNAFPIEVDKNTGQITMKDVVDPKTGKIDPNMVQVMNIVDPKEPVVQITTIVAKRDPKTGQVDVASGRTEVSNGKVNPSTGEIVTKHGVVNLKLMRISFIDPKTGRVEEMPIQIDSKDNIIVVRNPETAEVIQVGSEVDPEIQITTYVGKLDTKKGTVESKNAQPQTSVGLYDPEKDKIYTKYGMLDPVALTLAVAEPKSGKIETCQGHIDPATGDVVFKGVLVPKTGKIDHHQGRSLSVHITEPIVDPVAEKQVSVVVKTSTPIQEKVATPVKIQQVPDFQPTKNVPKNRIIKIMVITSKKDPKTNKVDVENGTVEHITGIYNPQNGLVETKLGLIDPKNGTIVARDPITGQTEQVQGHVDPATGHIHVSSGTVVDPATGKPDPTLGQVLSVVGLKAAQEPPTATPLKKRVIKIMVITTKIDPKTGKIDPEKGQVEYSTASLNPQTGYIESKYGLIDPKNGKLILNDPKTGKVDAKSAQVDETTGQIIVGSNVVDPKTGKADPHLGQIISIVGQNDPVIEIVTITGMKDPNTGAVDPNSGKMEATKGKLNSATGEVTTKYGVINLKLMKITTKDPNGQTETRPIEIDDNGNIYVSTGVKDPKTDTEDPSMGQIIQIGSEVEPEVQIATFTGKVDAKKNTIDAKNAVPELSTGIYNPDTHKVDTKFGQIDPVNGTLTYVDPKSGKTEVKQGVIDAATGQILFKGNYVNPKTGRVDPSYGRVVSVAITEPELTSAGQITEKDPKNFKVDQKTGQIWTFDHQDPTTGQAVYSSGQIDPVTGYIITIYGFLDPKSGQISKLSKVDQNNTKIDPDTNQIFTKTAEVDETGAPLYSVSQIDPATGQIYTKYGKVDPKTGKLVIIRIYLITQSDPTGKVKEIDPRDCQIDEKTGKIINVTTQTVYMYSMVDPKTGKIVQVDPNDPLVKSANTKVTQVLTLSGEIDPVTGKIHTEWGHIDPKTGEIDPKTARTDPVTGELILNYAQIDPSHFSDLKDTKVKVTTQTFPHQSSSGDESSDDDLEQYKAENLQDISQLKIPKKVKAVSTPVVVKTTTKQIVTKDRDGVTQNIEEKVEDGRTGEVTISTQVNKVRLFLFFVIKLKTAFLISF